MCNTLNDFRDRVKVEGNAFFTISEQTFEGTIITRTREFSKTSIHHPNQISQEFTDFDIGHDKFRHQYKPKIYANGYNSINQGYVSLIFCLSNLPDTMIGLRITFIISLVDAERREIFPQSFTFNIDEPSTADKKWPIITIDNYISRSVLLKEATELIPVDTLTLSIEVCLKELHKVAYEYDIYENLLIPSFETEEGLNGKRIFLLLDSLVADKLKEESEYFRRMSDAPMKEKSTGKMEISHQEFDSFLIFGYILFGANSIKFQYIDDIISLYIVSEKYGINSLINTSRHFLKHCFSLETVDTISQIADFYNDIPIKKAVMVFNDVNKVSDEKFINYCETYFPAIDRRWICKRLANDSEYVLMFDCFLDLSVSDDDDDKINFDFYH